MKPPVAGYKDSLPPNARAILDHVLQCSAVGTVDDVAAGLKAFVARTVADEVIVASSMYDHGERKRPFALPLEAAKSLYTPGFTRLSPRQYRRDPKSTRLNSSH